MVLSEELCSNGRLLDKENWREEKNARAREMSVRNQEVAGGGKYTIIS
jgi:hypothetical protein